MLLVLIFISVDIKSTLLKEPIFSYGHNVKFVTLDCGGCHCDNLLCHHWRQRWHHEDPLVSMTVLYLPFVQYRLIWSVITELNYTVTLWFRNIQLLLNFTGVSTTPVLARHQPNQPWQRFPNKFYFWWSWVKILTMKHTSTQLVNKGNL